MSARAQQFKDAGNAAFKLSNWPLALAHYDSAIQLDPSVPTYPLNRSAVHLKLQNYPKAEKDSTTALELEGGRGAKARYRRGQARRALGKLEEAKEDFAAALAEGAGGDVAELLAAVTKELEAKMAKEQKKPAGEGKENGGAESTSSAATAAKTKKERLQAALSPPSSATPSPSPSPSDAVNASPSAPPPSKPLSKEDGLLRPVSTRRLTPASSSTASSPAAPKAAVEAAPSSTPTPPCASPSPSTATASALPTPVPAAPAPVSAPTNAFAAAKAAREARKVPSYRSTPPQPPSTSSPPPPISAPSSAAPPSLHPPPIPSASSATTPLLLPVPATPTALEALFLSTPPNSPLLLAAVRALPTTPSSRLREWMGDNLTPDLLSSILSVLASSEGEGEDEGGAEWKWALVKALTGCRRWSSAVMFLSEEEKEVVRAVVEGREKEVKAVREAWGI